MAEQRKLWKTLQGGWDASRLVFIDETAQHEDGGALWLGCNFQQMHRGRTQEKLDLHRGLDPCSWIRR